LSRSSCVIERSPSASGWNVTSPLIAGIGETLLRDS